MAGPIKFDNPNEKVGSGEKARKSPQAPEKFKEIMEDDADKKSVAMLKKHNKNLDSESEDLEEFGKVKEEKKDVSLFELSSTKDKPKQKEKTEMEAAQDKPDLNPKERMLDPGILNQGAAAAIQSAKVDRPATNIQEVINQIVQHIQEMSYAGKTETIVTLKHPPLLAGAKLVLTSFDSAKGEFNIQFEGLTQAGKQLLDANLDSLRAGLEQKGFVSHIVTTTTIEETRVHEGLARSFPEREGGRDQKQQQREKQKDQEEEA